MYFTLDKENKRIKIEREFTAPVVKVWAAWTESKLLDQWWAPKPWQARTKILDFTVGGYWLYAMVGPDGTEHWARVDFKSISPLESFSALDAFCDEQGNINDAFPQSEWKSVFAERDKSTFVNIEIIFDELSDLQKIVELGFKEGITAAFQNLDELFKSR